MNTIINTRILREELKKKGWTYADLCEASSVSIQTVKRLGSCRYIPLSYKALRRMAGALGIEDLETVQPQLEELTAYHAELQEALRNAGNDEKARKRFQRRLVVLEATMQPRQHS